MSWIDEEFPQASGKYAVKSEVTDEYNCIAFAADDKSKWWSHLPGYKWPAPRSPRIDSLVAVFTGLGYSKCKSAAREKGLVKVALYHKTGLWKHAARQLASGVWVSKLGGEEDIEHNDPECLCGDVYGELYCLMQKEMVA